MYIGDIGVVVVGLVSIVFLINVPQGGHLEEGVNAEDNEKQWL